MKSRHPGDGDGDGAWLDYVLRRSAFTIKPPIEACWSTSPVAVDGESSGRVVPRVPTRRTARHWARRTIGAGTAARRGGPPRCRERRSTAGVVY